MARTWSYRKREIVINEVKPKGVPPVAIAFLLLSVTLLTIVLSTAIYFTRHQQPDPVITGPKSDSYRTKTPDSGGLTDNVH
ncbi:MAG TPA: hypothetical protein VGK19_03510 [Capsulimonadaceae bacterium]|jgi:hypothetical protein